MKEKRIENGANGMRDPSTQRYAVASIEGSEPDWH
jgi:hypothetical protein